MSWLITGAQPFTANALLDQFPGAAVAYSLRNLVGTSNPNVVRVRRSSDNTEQDFTAAQVINGTLTTFCGAGNGFVRTWYDQSGNGYHAQQATTANQPQIVSSGLLISKNGKPAMNVDGAGDTLTATITPLLTYTNLSVFTVHNPATATVADSVNPLLFGIENGGGNNTVQRGLSIGGPTGSFSGETYAFLFAASAFAAGRLGSSSYSHAADSQLLQSVFMLSSGFSAFKNGSLITMNLSSMINVSTPCAPVNTNATVPSFHIGTIDGVNGQLQKYQEVVVYGSSQDARRTAIEANINTHYAIY